MQVTSYSIKEFKQCPFCGRIWMSIGTFSENHYAVQCLCGATGPKEKSRAKAVRAWNLRDQHLFWNPFRLSIRFPDNSNTVDFKGRLESFDLATILQMLASKEKTGILQLSKGHFKSAICLKNGNILAASDSNGLRLGQILLNSGMISHHRLRETLQKAKESGKMFGEVLLSMNYIDENTLKDVIQQQVQEAVLELFFWKEGRFEYRDCLIEFDERGMKEINTLEIIMESARRMDEWNELKQRKESTAPSPPSPVPFRLKPPRQKS
jgi:Lar family restriction alleviation protein